MSNKEPTLMELLQASTVIDRNIRKQSDEQELREALAKAGALFGGEDAPLPQLFFPAAGAPAAEAKPEGSEGLAPTEPLAGLYPDPDEDEPSTDENEVQENGQTGSDGLDAAQQVGDIESLGPQGEEDAAVGTADQGEGAEGVLTEEEESVAPPAPVVTSPWEEAETPAVTEKKGKK